MTRTLSVLLAMMFTATSLSAQEAQLRPVKLIELSEENELLEREFFGRVVARQTVDLAFQVSGQVLEFPVLEGSRLAQGDLIAQLDLEPFELSLDRAKLELEQANRRLNRQETLGADTVSQVSIDDAGTAVGLAEIGVRDAEVALKNATLRAPFDALVAARNVANFSTVSSGTPVARLHDMSELRIEIDVPEVLFRQAESEQTFDISAVFPGDKERYPLEMREFKAETNNVGQTYTVTLGMEPIDDPSLIPGASATVLVRQQQGGTAIRIPASALVMDPDESLYLMVFEPAGAEEGRAGQDAHRDRGR